MKLKIHFFEKKNKHGSDYRYARYMETYKGQKLVVSCPARKGTPTKVLTETLAKKLVERKAVVDSASVANEPNLTVNQLADLFMKDALDLLKPKTIEERERVLRNWIKPTLGSMKVRNVRSADISIMLDKAQLNSASTLEHVWKVVKRMFSFALENEYAITANPITEGLKKRIRGALALATATKETRDIGLGVEEVDAIFQEVKGQPFQIPFHWMLFCGMRIGEALGMKWEDVDFTKDEVNVRRHVSGASKSLVKGTHWAEDDGPMVTTPKTKRGLRSIPLQAQTKELLELTPEADRHGFIYRTSTGTPFWPNHFRNRAFNPLRKTLGIPKLAPHDMRRFFGSFQLAHIGTDLITVSKWMGHANPETTMRIYAKLIPELENESKFKMGRAFAI